ncbi:carbohydrate-binding protein [Chitiniphilus shinanonensis]|uniref:carbohydrate-binding protein n=1 Tax=Chitiniphilus shinanonensis TaxID=553088 RepID=UPI0030298CF8
MNKQRIGMLAALPLALLLIGAPVAGKTISWSGHQWEVRSGGGGPGPNNWDDRNAWVDEQGYLHLKIANRDGVWSSAEIQLANLERLGFGTYQFKMLGRPDLLDKNAVFGFYTYPPADVGGDSTNEIDIEFSRWGNDFALLGNYTVWPAVNGANRSWRGFDFTLTSDRSTHRFNWQSDKVVWQSMQGFVDVNQTRDEFMNWTFDPRNPPANTDTRDLQFYCRSGDPLQCIAQKPQYFLINLWQVGGRAPSNNQEIELVLTEFTHVPGAVSPTPTPGPTPTPQPTPTPTTVPTPTPTQQPTPTPTPGTCYQAWSASAIYTGGQRVTYNGVNYEAKWWTQGENPTLSDQYGVWKNLGACAGATPTPQPTPTPTPVVTPTPTPVITPTPEPTPTPVGNCPAWTEGTAYAVGACVSYQGRQYRALIAHTPPVGGGWTPVIVPVLWQPI